jgi:hypothetical protein
MLTLRASAIGPSTNAEPVVMASPPGASVAVVAHCGGGGLGGGGGEGEGGGGGHTDGVVSRNVPLLPPLQSAVTDRLATAPHCCVSVNGALPLLTNLFSAGRQVATPEIESPYETLLHGWPLQLRVQVSDWQPGL